MSDIDNMDKKCIKCGVTKSLCDFPKDSSRKDGYYVICKECRKKPVDVTIVLDEKTCIRCGIIKPISEFYGSRCSKDGHMNTCKECRDVVKTDYVVVNEKQCNKCNVIKPIDAFNNDIKSHDGHKTICKECLGKQKAEYNRHNQELNTDEYIAQIDKEFPTKVCMGCMQVKSKSQFDIRRSSLDGHSSYCNECHINEHQEDFHNHKEMSDEEYREWRIEENAKRKAETIRVKNEVFAHYCGGNIKCANPFHLHNEEVTDLDVLSIDHINGDGYKERRGSSGSRGGITYYRRLKKEGYPSGLQVLCFNCQIKKRVINNEYYNGKTSFEKYQGKKGYSKGR